MKIFRLRHKRNKNRFYKSLTHRRSFFSRLSHLQLSTEHDTSYNPDSWELIEYSLVESSISPAPNKLKKLTRDEVQAIRRQASEGINQLALARKYGVGATTIRRIIKHEVYHE